MLFPHLGVQNIDSELTLSMLLQAQTVDPFFVDININFDL